MPLLEALWRGDRVLPFPGRMKRVHVPELEDLSWFPSWLRACMTRLIVVFSPTIGVTPVLASLVSRGLPAPAGGLALGEPTASGRPSSSDQDAKGKQAVFGLVALETPPRGVLVVP